MRISLETARRAGEQNIVPMINVVFLLLIFFLLAGTLAPRPPFHLDPVATTLQPPGDVPERALYVSGEGRMFLQGKPLTVDGLAVAAKARRGAGNDTLDVIVDRRLTGETLFPIMEALANSGLTKVRLVTERSAGG